MTYTIYNSYDSKIEVIINVQNAMIVSHFAITKKYAYVMLLEL